MVSKQDNASMHKILTYYNDLTGLPVLINTSFNMHEEPIVCSPLDAIRAFKEGRLDYLAIGNYLANNDSPLSRNVDSSKYDDALERRGSARKY